MKMEPEVPNVIKVEIDLETLAVKTQPEFISEKKPDQLVLACAPKKFYHRLKLFDDSPIHKPREVLLAYVKRDDFALVNTETGKPMRNITYFKEDI